MVHKSLRRSCVVVWLLVLVAGLLAWRRDVRAAQTGGNQATQPAGRKYFVAPNGADTNSGAEEKPFASPALSALAVTPGDTVLIKAVTYSKVLARFDWAAILEVTTSGRADAPITFAAYRQPDGRYDTVVLDKQGTGRHAVWVHHCR